MNLSWLIPVHKHSRRSPDPVLPVVVVIVALLRGGSILPRITAVLLDVQILLGVFTLILVTKSVSVLHIVCMAAALGLAHAFAKKDNRTAVAGSLLRRLSRCWCSVTCSNGASCGTAVCVLTCCTDCRAISRKPRFALAGAPWFMTPCVGGAAN